MSENIWFSDVFQEVFSFLEQKLRKFEVVILETMKKDIVLICIKNMKYDYHIFQKYLVKTRYFKSKFLKY